MEGRTLKQLTGDRAGLIEGASRISGAARARVSRMLGSRVAGGEDPIVRALAGRDVADVACRTGWSTLVVRTLPYATLVAVYGGTTLLAEGAVPLLEGREDSAAARADAIRRWFGDHGLRLSELSGIAAGGGFMAPVPPGTYRLGEAMADDLSESRFPHAENLAVPAALALGAEIGRDAVLTTTDPRSACGAEALRRRALTASLGAPLAVAHFASLRAAAGIVASSLGAGANGLRMVAAHFGRESSAALLAGGRVSRVAPCFGALPSATAPGRLPTADVLLALAGGETRPDVLADEVFRGGGGLARLLGGPLGDDFVPSGDGRVRSLLTAFACEGAAGLMELAAGETPVDAVAITGELMRDGPLFAAIAARLPLCAPVVAVPGSIEASALCAGLLGACADPSLAKDYAVSRDRLAAETAESGAAFDAALAPAGTAAPADVAGRPVESIGDIIARARPAAGEALPVIAIAGADNEEALIAARLANGEGGERLARFLLVGPYGPISELAWELDVPIDEDNFFVVDSTTPVETAVGLYADGVADIVMKGSVTTAALLKGYFGVLKARGMSRPGMKLSHLGMFEVPGRGRLIGITDAAINPDPDVDARAVILESAVAAMHALGIERPKVAVISATEKPSDKVVSSIEGQELAQRFADRTDLVIEGPISVDLALSPESAHEKKYKGRIRGDADLLLVPTLDVGNAIYKSLTVTSGATIAGAVVGGAAPIVLTSRGDRARSKLASVALAIALAKHAGKEETR